MYIVIQMEFESRVLRQSDIFLNSNPAEWERFQEYVEANKPFLAVVDGLNVFYLRNMKAQVRRVVWFLMGKATMRILLTLIKEQYRTIQ